MNSNWDHDLETGRDMLKERQLLWKEAIVILLVLGIAAVRLFLV